MKRMVSGGEMLPKWYGVAWYEFDVMRGACYPVPINLLTRWARCFWNALRRGFGPGLYDHQLKASHEAGVHEGERRMEEGLKRRCRDCIEFVSTEPIAKL